MNRSIVPNCLVAARQHRGMAIDELARLANLQEERVVALEESETPTEVSPGELICLSESLRLAPEVLTGERPIPADAGRFGKQAVSVNLSGRARRDCELVRMRYGVSREELMEMAPLMFTLVAEDVLRWRRDRAKRARQVLRDLDFAQNLAGLRFQIEPLESGENGEPPGMADSEEESIASRDVFGERVTGPRGIKPRAPQAFSDYLQARIRHGELDGALAFLAEDLGAEEDESIWGSPTHWPGDRLPVHRVLPDQVYELVGLAPAASPTLEQLQALMALNLCQVELADLPNELMAEDKAPDRVAWINHQARPAAA